MGELAGVSGLQTGPHVRNGQGFSCGMNRAVIVPKRGSAQIGSLVPACALLLWTILPALCMTLCGAKACCPEPAPVSRSEGACSHCPPSKGWATAKKSTDCCAWIAKRGDPPTISHTHSWTFQLVAVLPEEVPAVVEHGIVESPQAPEYTGLAPPVPVACRLSTRAPPIG